MKREFRISVSFPFSPLRMWVSGSASNARLDDVVQGYDAKDVPEVVEALKRIVAHEAVITVY